MGSATQDGAHGGCDTCHADSDALRSFDTLRSPATDSELARASHFGAGAVCAECHGGLERTFDPSRIPLRPQAAILRSEGARTVETLVEPPHRFIADTCTRCHMARLDPSDPDLGRVGDHTFAIGTSDGGWHARACAPCHGEPDPTGSFSVLELRNQVDTRIAQSQSNLSRAITELFIVDDCAPANTASRVVASQGMLLLYNDRHPLGDCNADGAIGANERLVDVTALPADLAAAAYDLALLEADGSHGAHNPVYTNETLRSIDATIALH